MDESQRKIVHYAPYCRRGEIIALLYNHAIRVKSGSEISPEGKMSSETVEGLVRAQLGDVKTLGGRTIPRDRGLINAIEGVTLNVYCCDGAIDVSGYPHGDGRALIQKFISKRLSDLARAKVRSTNWESIS